MGGEGVGREEMRTKVRGGGGCLRGRLTASAFPLLLAIPVLSGEGQL